MLQKLIVDTSFLMIPGMFGVDVLVEVERLMNGKPEMVVPNAVISELEHLQKTGSPKERSAARIALELSKRGVAVEVGFPTDRAIVELATEMGASVGTTDLELRATLRKRGIPVIFLRGKSHLAIEGKSAG